MSWTDWCDIVTESLIHRIIRQSFVDGPGSRMALFFQGCNLRCLYCHNPETQGFCKACGRCVPGCPGGALSLHRGKIRHDPSLCLGCDACLVDCPNFASPRCQTMTVDEVLSLIRTCSDFLDGVTLSGGECTLQHAFILELFQVVHQETHLTTFIDTNGLMDSSVADQLCTVTDGFLFDLKALDPDIHLRLTGRDNQEILQNMEQISARGLLHEIRTVVVPGFNDSEGEIGRIAEWIRQLNAYSNWRLIPFRPHGVRSYLGHSPSLGAARLAELLKVAREVLGKRACSPWAASET